MTYYVPDEPGLYWVRYEDSSEWTIIEWYGREGVGLGSGLTFLEDEFARFVDIRKAEIPGEDEGIRLA